MMEQYAGKMPADYEKLRALPGIGDYTAGAISSIAFGLLYPAVDGNVLRVMSRIACSEADITKEQTKKKLKEDLTIIMPKKSGDFNQSLMELGATICLPNGKPLCEQCPVMHLCRAFHAEREMELPVKSAKRARRIEKRVVYVISYEGRVLLHRRERKGLLAGLWEFPNVLLEEGGQAAKEKAAVPEKGYVLSWAAFLEKVQFRVQKTKKAKHIFSHVEWHMEGVWIEVEADRTFVEEAQLRVVQLLQKMTQQTDTMENWVFATAEELQEIYAIPSAFEAFL